MVMEAVNPLFDKLAKNGYLPHMLPILPPDAELTPKCGVKPEQRGKVPGEYLPDTRQWRGLLGWTKWETTAADIEKYATWPGVGIGLRTGVLVGVDIDIFTNKALADAIEEIFITELGLAPQRIGYYPKRLLLYRLNGEPQGKRKIEYSRQDENGIIEILGKGQQCVAYGIHPKTGKPYSWTDALDNEDGPASVTFDKLPEVTNEQIDAVFLKVELYLKEKGYETKKAKSEASKKGVSTTPLPPGCIDGEIAISKAITYLKGRAPIAKDGASGNATTFRVACELANYAVSKEKALELMSEHWNKVKAIPPWSEEELQAIIENAYRYNSNGFGSKHPAAIFDRVDGGADTPGVSGRRRFQPYTIEQLEILPDVEYLIKKVIDKNGLSVMYGKSNCGKTFTALEMALHIALGWEWRGHKTRQGKVFYIAAEAGFGIKKRIKAFMKHHNLTYADIPDFHLLPKGVNFCSTKEDAEEIIKEINILGGKVEIVFIDTLSRAMAGGDENSPVDMGAFVKNCDLIRQETPAAAGIVHHTGKDATKGSRGHYSLVAAVDTEFAVTNTNGTVTVEITKQRDGERGATYSATLKVIDIGIDDEGKPITSCVLIQTEGETPKKKKPTVSGRQERALDILHRLTREEGIQGVPKDGMQEITFVRLDDFRAALKDENIVASDDPDSVRRGISAVIEALNNKEITATYKDMIWTTGQTG